MTWPLVRLGDVVSVDSRTARPEEFQTTDTYVGLDNIGPDGVLENLEATDATTLKSNKSRFDASHVLFGKLRPYLVNVARPDQSGICSTDILTIRPSEVMSRDFLYWWLRRPSTIERATEFSTGATLPRISPKALLEFEVPLPSPETQERVVALLDEATAAVAELEALYSQTASKLDDLRVSALAAVMGSNDWPSAPLEELLSMKIGGVWGKEHGSDEVDVHVLRVTELQADGTLDPTTAANRSITHRQLSSRSLERGDLLLEKSGGGPNTPVGRVGIVGDLHGPSVCSNFMLLMRPDANLVKPSFLHLYLNHFHASGRTENLQSNSTNIRNVRTSEYLELGVPVPPLDEQERILAHLDEVLAAAEEALELTADRLEAARSLRQSVLEAAFRGEF